MRAESFKLLRLGGRVRIPVGSVQEKASDLGHHIVEFHAVSGVYPNQHMADWSRVHRRTGFDGPGCECESWSSIMVYRARSSTAIGAEVRGVSCPHATVIEVFESPLPLTAGVEVPAAASDVVQGAVLDALESAGKENGWSDVGSVIDMRMADTLSGILANVVDGPFSALLEGGGTDPVDTDSVMRLVSVKAAMGVIIAIGSAARFGAHTSEVLSVGVARVDSALTALTAVQSLQAQQLARAVAETESRRDAQARRRDRRLARLGAITLFPMLVLSFMGTNVLPRTDFSFSWVGPFVLPVTVVAAIGAAVAGLFWIDSSRFNSEFKASE